MRWTALGLAFSVACGGGHAPETSAPPPPLTPSAPVEPPAPVTSVAPDKALSPTQNPALPALPAPPFTPPVPDDAPRERVEWEPGYGFEIARTEDGVWATYDRPAGVAPAVRHRALPAGGPPASSRRVVPVYQAGADEHGGFVVLDVASLSAFDIQLRSYEPAPLVRAPRIEGSSPEDPHDALRSTVRVRFFDRCFTGRRSQFCYAYGSPAELAAIPTRLATDGYWRPRAVRAPLTPPPAAPEASDIVFTARRDDVELVVATYGERRTARRAPIVDETDVAAWIRRGSTLELAFAYRGSVDEAYEGGVEPFEGQWFAWIWRPDWVATSGSFHEEASLARIGEPVQYVDTSSKEDVDCWNAITNTRPVLARDTDGWHIALTWPDATTAVLYDTTPRVGRVVEMRHGGDVEYYSPRSIAPLHRVVVGASGLVALEPLLAAR